ncbi:MAG TPA: hypothetical protein VI072_01040 [Polyangiaceae bacterium]
MNDDLLRQAASALREETKAAEQPAAFTRARIMASLHGGKRRRRWHVAVLVPIAAVLAGSTALAGVGKGITWQGVAVAVGLQEPSADPARVAPKVFSRAPFGARRSSRAPEAVSFEARIAEMAPLAEPEPARVEQLTQGAAAEALPKRRVAAAGNRGPVAAPAITRQSRPADPELDLYRSAHALHFSGADPRAALAAWDAYLARAPRGRFALEARYNRAICLARLGQTSAAESALEPFASGEHGEYRKESARALRDALSGQK